MPGDSLDAEPLDFTGHDLFADPSAVWACKRPIVVRVEFADADGAMETLEGRVSYRAGDALLAGTRGDRWPVAAARFFEDYEPSADESVGGPEPHDADDAARAAPTPRAGVHRYTKKPRFVRARRMPEQFVVRVGVAGERLRGGPGDWLVQYREGEYGVVSAGPFAETYSIVEGSRR